MQMHTGLNKEKGGPAAVHWIIHKSVLDILISISAGSRYRKSERQSAHFTREKEVYIEKTRVFK